MQIYSKVYILFISLISPWLSHSVVRGGCRTMKLVVHSGTENVSIMMPPIKVVVRILLQVVCLMYVILCCISHTVKLISEDYNAVCDSFKMNPSREQELASSMRHNAKSCHLNLCFFILIHSHNF
jgi:hypothetical protein